MSSRSVILAALITIFLVTLTSTYLLEEQEEQVVSTNSIQTLEKNARLLQNSGGPTANTKKTIEQLIRIINKKRTDKGIKPLKIDTQLNLIISQWAIALRRSMSLVTYMQLFGYQGTNIIDFEALPADFMNDVILKKAEVTLLSSTFTDISYYSETVNSGYDRVLLVVKGGYDETEVRITEKETNQIIAEIKAERAKLQEAKKTQEKQPQTLEKIPTIIDNQPKEQLGNVNQTLHDTKETAAGTHVAPTQTDLQLIITPPKQEEVNVSAIDMNTTSTQGKKETLQSITQPAKTASPKQITPQNTPILPLVNSISQEDNKKPIETIQPTKTSQKNQQSPQVSPNVKPIQTVKPTQPIKPTQSTAPKQPLKPIQPLRSTDNLQTTETVKPDSTPKVEIPDTTFIPQALPMPTVPTLPLISQTTFKDTKTFADVILTHGVPSTFVKNEYFPFKGYLTIPNPNGVQLNVIFTRTTDQKRLIFSQELPPQTKNFKIMTQLTLTGTFYLSIFSGLSGQTTTEKYRVVPEFFGKIVSRAPKPLKTAKLSLHNNDLTLQWESSEETQPGLTQVIISQDFKRNVQFLLSNYEKKLVIPYKLFSAFNKGITNIQISQAFSLDESGASQTSQFSAPYFIMFNASQHYEAIVKKEANINPIQLKKNINDQVEISGKIKKDLKNEVILLTPNKQFQSYYFDQSKSKDKSAKISAGTEVNLKIPLKSAGTFLLEINDAQGAAVVNIPLYVGETLPLLPEYTDVSPENINQDALNSPRLLGDRRYLVLALINKVRSDFGVSDVYLDKDLNDLAQSYSELQHSGDFIGHYDPSGLGPAERARAAGILSDVGENIALNRNLTEAQLSLQRSPSHLRNMVDGRWTRVGLGIVQNRLGYYYLTQQFSSRDLKIDPLTDRELSLITQQIIKFIKNQFTHIKNEDIGLSRELAKYPTYGIRTPILKYLSDQGYRITDVINLKVNYNNGQFLKLIDKNQLKPISTQFQNVGVGVRYQDGLLEILAGYL